jgi:prevent-host-death family protein
MTRIGVRELRQHASRYLDEVKAGATVEVTERGELVALIVPPGPLETLRDRLVANGQLLAAKGTFRMPTRRRQVKGTPSASRHLEELRAER